MARSNSDIKEAELATFEEIRIRDCSIKRALDAELYFYASLIFRTRLSF